MDIVPIIGIPISFTATVIIIYVITRARSRRMELQAEMQSKLIDRFGSASELVAFLQSPAGRDFVAGVQSAPATLTRERILTGFSRSIILTVLGLGLVFLSFYYNDDFAFPATILFSLGIGFFLATLVSYKLSSSMNVTSGDDQPRV